ncbi:MAG: uroporphyrinogen-III C-methyltransferase [Planctomycetota bacterium]|nr:MAG: uroporphyrinogen-III C-methyltransferase [Planctomycetota bacterium]
MNPHDTRKTGRVYLVGAGPGDPGLITKRGLECLAQADVVLYDYLVNPLLLAHAPATAERTCLGRHGSDRIVPQQEINERMLRDAAAGKVVVRLKGGDPAIFARGAEEAEVLAANDVPFEVVPGITAALAAGSFAGIPVTHRAFASAVAFITGHGQNGDEPKLDYAALAEFPGTLVFYMGVTTCETWTSALVEAGKPADTPAAIVRRCSWTDQETFPCTLGTVAQEMKSRKLRPPVIVIVGEVCELHGTLSWLEERPLHGQTILVTRPREQAVTLCERLAELGAGCLLQPAISIEPPADWGPVDAALAEIERFDWLVFSSANGVRFLLERLLSNHGDLRRLASVQLAAIGPRTAEELARYHLTADLAPTEYRAEALAEALRDQASGRSFLLARASRGREVLADELTAAGADVTQVVVYESRDVSQPEPHLADALAGGKIDWITVTSSAIARSLVALFGEDLRRARLASISPVTSETLDQLGFAPDVEAREYTTEGVVEAILAAASDSR